MFMLNRRDYMTYLTVDPKWKALDVPTARY